MTVPVLPGWFGIGSLLSMLALFYLAGLELLSSVFVIKEPCAASHAVFK